MNLEDRQAFESLLRRHSQLEESLAQFKFDLKTLERRVELRAEIPEPVLPPALPPEIPQDIPRPPLPPIPPLAGVDFTPIAVSIPEPIEPKLEIPVMETVASPMPEVAPTESTEDRQRNLESQFGRWLARVGVVLLLLTVIYGSTVAYEHFHAYIGPWAKLTVLSLISIGLIALGLKMEKWDAKLTVYARTLAGGGLACLYYTLYGATYVAPLQVIHSHVLGGVLLLSWSAYVLYLAEQKKSELLSVFAIALAYFSSAITPVGDFTMTANLILSLTAVVFLIRNEWTGLSYLCLVGTYFGSLRQFVDYNSSTYGFDFSHTVEFWPAAAYLAGAWVIYTAGIFLANTPRFAAEKRMGFLWLNNGAFTGLLLTAATLSGFGHMGGILCWTGGLFLVAWQAARTRRADMGDVASAYLAQGLGLVTGGLAVVYTGVTRGLVITIESVFLTAAGAYSRNWIFKIAGYISALVGTAYLLSEMVIHDHLLALPICAVVAMLANAWFARREWWGKLREEANTFVLSSAYYVLLALVLAATGLFSAQLSDESITMGLAVTALVLTMAVYLVPIFELAPMCQILLIGAQLTAFVSFSDSTHQSASCQNLVALVTMILVTWWPKQKQVRTGFWLQGLLMVYAIAMMGYVFNNVHPHLDDQQWMMATSGLSLVFLAYGAWMRLWPFIVAGQLFLGYSVFLFLMPSLNGDLLSMPWTGWAAAVPPLTVYLTSWLIGYQLPRLMKASEYVAEQLLMAGYLYRSMALALVVRWIFGVVPAEETTLAFFALATGLLVWNCRWSNAFSARAALAIDIVGICSYDYAQSVTATPGFTWSDAMGVLLFLVQPAILRYWGRNLITHAESWAVVALSALLGWYFVSHSIDLSDAHDMTVVWALFALGLTVLGFAANERRQRWCGLGILVASIIRVGFYDFWGFSDLYKVLTFFVLTMICLGLSFLYYKFADRLKEWL
jgi:hypothetical protein